MKTNIFSILITVLLMLLFSCHYENITEKENSTTNPIGKESNGKISSINFNKAKETIKSMGFDTTSMYEEDNFYVVEGDILFNKSNVDNNSTMLRQYRTTYYTPNTGEVISIGVDNTISTATNWRAAVTQVINAYNQHSGLNFFYSENNPKITITKYTNSSTSVCAEGTFPTSLSLTGNLVRINSAFNSNGLTIDNLSLSQKTFLLIHEIGHNLGLRHTNGLSEGSDGIGLIQIPGTPLVDPLSFMNSYTCGNSWTGFSTGDIAAFNALWPSYLVSFNGDCSNIYVKPGSILDRSITPLNPMSNGRIFCGWYKDASLTIPWNYNEKINSNITLYSKWRSGVVNHYVETNSFTASSISFTVDQTTVVSFTAKVARGFWAWYEISPYPIGTYAIVGYQSSFNKRIDLAPYILNASTEDYQSHTEYLVLTPGTYWLAAGFPAELGPQNGASYKHGETFAIVQY